MDKKAFKALSGHRKRSIALLFIHDHARWRHLWWPLAAATLFLALPLMGSTIYLYADRPEKNDLYIIPAGSAQEKTLLSYLPLIGPDPLADYRALPLSSAQDGAASTFVIAKTMDRWLSMGMSQPSFSAPMTLADYQRASDAWLSFQKNTRLAIGARQSCPYLSVLNASFIWSSRSEARGACVAVFERSFFIYLELGFLAVLFYDALAFLTILALANARQKPIALRVITPQPVFAATAIYSCFYDWLESQGELTLIRVEKRDLNRAVKKRGSKSPSGRQRL